MGACASKAGAPVELPTAAPVKAAAVEAGAASASADATAEATGLASPAAADTTTSCDDATSECSAPDCGPSDLGDVAIAVVEALPHLSNARPLLQAVAREDAATCADDGVAPVVVVDDGTFRGPAEALMRMFDTGRAGVLRGGQLDGLLRTFVAGDAAACASAAEVALAVAALRRQLEALVRDPAAGVTVDDVEAWLEAMDRDDDEGDEGLGGRGDGGGSVESEHLSSAQQPTHHG
jgi:hypothetical protein